jgi:hypothetical protein
VLDAHRLLGRQKQRSPLIGEENFTPSSVILRSSPSENTWKAAGVGQDRPVPAHEACAGRHARDDLQPGPQPQVKGVAEADLGADVVEARAASSP